VSSSSEATTKLLSLLASYKDIREETASKLVANELLLDKLKGSKDDAQFKQHVDAALAADNAQLIEELVAAKHQAEREREQRETRDKEREEFEKQLKDERDGLLDERTTLTDRVGALTSELESVQTESVAAIGELKGSVATTQGRLDNIVHVLRVGIAVVCALGVILGSEYLIARYQWAWLSNHPNSYSLRLSAYLFVITFFLGLFKSGWRKYFWTGSVGCFALLLVLIGLLGGPKK
jgi:hypothetical protein